MTPLTDPAPQRVDAGRSTVAPDPLAGRLDDLERIARQAHAEDRIDDTAAALAARYITTVRAVLPRVTGWGTAQAGLMQATDQGIALLVRFMRVPRVKASAAADAWLPQPTVAGILADGLAILVRYAESLDQAVTDADVARLLELQRAVDLAFGPGFRPAHGIGDPARQPDPEPAPDDEPTPPRGPSLADILRDVMLGMLRAVPAEIWVAALAATVAATVLTIWRP